MTSISHALIGAALAAKISNPVLVAPIAFAVHFVCDAIPHWDLGTNWRLRPKQTTAALAILETIIAVFGTYLIFKNFVPQGALMVAIVFSLLPDWLEAPYYIFMPKAPKFFYYCYKIQSIIHSRMQFPMGLITQIITVGLFLWWGFGG